jgi:hypothetical protein
LQKRRIAELMSQLPHELDVERMVAIALGAFLVAPSAPTAAPGAAGNDPAGVRAENPSVSGGAKNGSAEPASAKDWKTIIRCVSGGVSYSEGVTVTIHVGMLYVPCATLGYVVIPKLEGVTRHTCANPPPPAPRRTRVGMHTVIACCGIRV